MRLITDDNEEQTELEKRTELFFGLFTFGMIVTLICGIALGITIEHRMNEARQQITRNK